MLLGRVMIGSVGIGGVGVFSDMAPSPGLAFADMFVRV